MQRQHDKYFMSRIQQTHSGRMLPWLKEVFKLKDRFSLQLPQSNAYAGTGFPEALDSPGMCTFLLSSTFPPDKVSQMPFCFSLKISWSAAEAPDSALSAAPAWNLPTTKGYLPKALCKSFPPGKSPTTPAAFNSSQPEQKFNILPPPCFLQALSTRSSKDLMTPGTGKGWLPPPCPAGPSCQPPFRELLLIAAKSFLLRLLPLNRPPWALQSCHLAENTPLPPAITSWLHGIRTHKASRAFKTVLAKRCGGNRIVVLVSRRIFALEDMVATPMSGY